MADRAIRQENSERDVFDLEKDERWQARLAEARARRAIALRDKANSEGPPKPRLKPWEEAGQSEPEVFEQIEPLLQPIAEDKLDFSDRVRTLRETMEGFGGNGGPTLEAPIEDVSPEPGGEKITPSIGSGSKDLVAYGDVSAERPESVADRYIRALSPDFVPVRPFVPENGGISEPSPERRGETRSADETERLAREHAASMMFEPEAEPVAAAAAEPAVRRRRRGVPALLLAGVCLLAVLPFATTVPPLEKGPASNVVMPQFGLVPALGITRPMNAFPRLTTSGEWRPVAIRPPRGALVLPLDLAATQQRSVDPLVPVAFGDNRFGSLGWSSLSSLPEQAEVAVLEMPRADRLPGVAEAVPSPEDMTASVPLPAAPLSLLNVTVFVPQTTDASIADEIASDLTARGHSISAITPVNLKISERNIRFFHEEDRGEAARLAEAYDARLRDFTSFRPSPAEGTVEIWLAGEGISRPAVVAAPAPAAEPPVVTPRVVIVRRTPSLLERLTGVLGGHEGDGLPNPAFDDGPSVTRPSALAAPTGTAPSSGTTEQGAGAAGGSGTSDGTGGTSTTSGSGATSSGSGSTGSTGTSGSTGTTGATGTAGTGSTTGTGTTGTGSTGTDGEDTTSSDGTTTGG